MIKFSLYCWRNSFSSFFLILKMGNFSIFTENKRHCFIHMHTTCFGTSSTVKICNNGAREMAQCLRAPAHSEQLKLSSQHPHDSSQLCLTPFLGDPTLSSGFFGHQACIYVGHRLTCRPNARFKNYVKIKRNPGSAGDKGPSCVCRWSFLDLRWTSTWEKTAGVLSAHRMWSHPWATVLGWFHHRERVPPFMSPNKSLWAWASLWPPGEGWGLVDREHV